MEPAKIYLRRNGRFGASCDGIMDTGHEIREDSGKFTVLSIADDGTPICTNASQAEAEAAIEADWHAA